jgi:hypothetical protein
MEIGQLKTAGDCRGVGRRAADSIGRARHEARRAAEPDGSTVSIGGSTEKPSHSAGLLSAGVPWWTFFELQVCMGLLVHTPKSAQR